jgi:hypothetical protein
MGIKFNIIALVKSSIISVVVSEMESRHFYLLKKTGVKK